MLNQSADHALRAVLFVARQPVDVPCSAETIATTLNVPRNYLGKLLNTLAQTGVLHSTRGPRGGFTLAVDPAFLTLAQVVEPFHRLPERRACLLGNGACDPSSPCESHERWQTMADHLTAFFENTTVAVMLRGSKGSNGSNGTGRLSLDERSAPSAT
jgi:Rrf2 family transcriptional regulator, iron-sulfur cluster assembly transcription factor